MSQYRNSLEGNIKGVIMWIFGELSKQQQTSKQFEKEKKNIFSL